MGLITKEVEMLLTNNIKHYEELGYEIPRVEKIYYHKNGNISNKKYVVLPGTKIKVQSEDLPKNSRYDVEVQCDCCDKIYNQPYASYCKYNRDGKIYCKQCTMKLFMSGEKHFRWKTDKTQEERINGRNYDEYYIFIRKVLQRDDYTCQCCKNKVDGDANVHHLDGYDWCQEKRTDETNGITLCENCHKNFHSVYGYGNNTKQQFEEWIEIANLTLEKYNGKLNTSKIAYCIEDKIIINNVMTYCKENNFDFSCIYDCCNKKLKSYRGKHYIWNDEYIKMTTDDLEKYLKWCNTDKKSKRVICLNTMEIFQTITQANQYYKTTYVGACCQEKCKYAGKLEDGTRLQWMYYEEYLKLSKIKLVA